MDEGIRRIDSSTPPRITPVRPRGRRDGSGEDFRRALGDGEPHEGRREGGDGRGDEDEHDRSTDRGEDPRRRPDRDDTDGGGIDVVA